MPRTKTRALLTRQALAAYLGVDPNTLSIAKSGAERTTTAGNDVKFFAGLPEPVLMLGERELRDTAEVMKWAPEWIQGSRRNAKRELNPAALERAVRLPVGKTIVSNVEIGLVFGIDSTAVAKRRAAGYLPAPLVEFDTARTPPAYDLDEVLEKNAGLRSPMPVEEAAVAELRRSHTLTEA